MKKGPGWLRWSSTLLLVVVPFTIPMQRSHASEPPGQHPSAVALPPTVTMVGPPTSGTTDVAQLSRSFSEVVQRVLPTVVMLRVEVQLTPEDVPPELLPFLGMNGRGLGRGQSPGQGPIMHGGASGVIVREDGVILTNAHVVERSRRIDVQLADGRGFRARVLGVDVPSDLALIRIEARGLPVARLADSDQSRVGEWVIAIGAPLGLDASVTQGVLSGKGRGGLGANEIEDYLQTDARINPGNSGGPLVNLRGEVLGINTMILGRSSGIGMAIPSRLAQSVTEQILRTGRVAHPWIGASVQDITGRLAEAMGTGNVRGALVNKLEPGAPAARAGLQVGDVVTAINGRTIASRHDLVADLARRSVGEDITVTVQRDGTPHTIVTRAINHPEARGSGPGPHVTATASRSGSRELGLRLATVPRDLAERTGIPNGAVVLDVDPGSAGDEAGLRRGDIILRAGSRTVHSPVDVRTALQNRHAGLLVRRGDAQAYMPVFLD